MSERRASRVATRRATVHPNRLMLSLDVVQRGSGWEPYFRQTQHGTIFGALHREKREAFAQRLEGALGRT